MKISEGRVWLVSTKRYADDLISHWINDFKTNGDIGDDIYGLIYRRYEKEFREICLSNDIRLPVAETNKKDSKESESVLIALGIIVPGHFDENSNYVAGKNDLYQMKIKDKEGFDRTWTLGIIGKDNGKYYFIINDEKGNAFEASSFSNAAKIVSQKCNVSESKNGWDYWKIAMGDMSGRKAGELRNLI